MNTDRHGWGLALLMVGLVLASGVATARYAGSEPRLAASGPDGVEIEIGGAGYRLSVVTLEGRQFDRVTLPGAVWLPEPGRPAVPTRGELLGVPYGADLSVHIPERKGEQQSPSNRAR